MNYKLRKFLADDFSRLCKDLEVSEIDGFYFEAWARDQFFEGFAVDGDSYLVRIPDPAPENLVMLAYLFKFEGRVFLVAAQDFGDEAWVKDAADIDDDGKQRVAANLTSAFLANGYYGAGSMDRVRQMEIKWA